MMKKRIFIVFLGVLCVMLTVTPCFAGTNSEISEHDLEFLNAFVPIYSFQAVSVDESGAFAVLSRYQKESGYDKPSWVCIEVFRPDGSFRTAIRFTDPGGDYLRLDGDVLYIYQLDRALAVDLNSHQAQRLSVGYEKGLPEAQKKQLRESSFIAGTWQYSSKRSISGWTELRRTDGTQTQVLLSLEEKPQFVGLCFVPLVLLLAGLTVFVVYKKLKKTAQNQ